MSLVFLHYLSRNTLSEVNNSNPKVMTQLIYVSTIYEGRYQHVADTLPTRYQHVTIPYILI